jgi:hypothetical protein
MESRLTSSHVTRITQHAAFTVTKMLAARDACWPN